MQVRTETGERLGLDSRLGNKGQGAARQRRLKGLGRQQRSCLCQDVLKLVVCVGAQRQASVREQGTRVVEGRVILV